MSVQVSSQPIASPSYQQWRRTVDRSTNLSFTLFVASGALWLLLGSLLTLMVQVKLLYPEWLGNSRWLTYGRLYPMAQNAFVYGWLSNAAMGMTTWLWARLTRSDIQGKLFLLSAGGLWNTGVAIGLIGIMAGFSRGMLDLDMPVLAFACLVSGAFLFAASIFITWARRRQNNLYVSVWYLGAGVIWFLFILVTSLLPLEQHLEGAIYGAWFSHSLRYLWIAPVGLGAAYYLIPKITGRAIYSYPLALPGFLTLALFASWSSAISLIGGPAPFWLSSASIAFSVLMLVPVMLISFNLLMSFKGRHQNATRHPSSRFIRFGAVGFLIFGLLGSLSHLRSLNLFTQFTFFEEAIAQFGLYGFASMTAFGAIYYILQRLTGQAWKQAKSIRLHFAMSASGFSLLVLANLVSGLSQGASFSNVEVAFVDTLSLSWLWIGALGILAMAIGHVTFGNVLIGIIKDELTRS